MNNSMVQAEPLPALSKPVGHPSFGWKGKARFLFVLCTAILVAAGVDHIVARWIGMPTADPVYRRIGPESGPQAFLAGSSVLQSGITWSEVSSWLGQGIENWGVGGSSPVEWEAAEALWTNAQLTIVGGSVYDFNEYHFCDARAAIVPVTRTVEDLWNSGSGWQFSKHLLSQYPLAYVRKLFPTAGESDVLLAGVRRRLREVLRLSSAADDRAILAMVAAQHELKYGDVSLKLSDWPKARVLRQLALMRSHVQGMHAFNGPKKLALQRMLERGARRGRVILVILPVAPAYAHEFLTPELCAAFEKTLADFHRAVPEAVIVRLDRVKQLDSNDFFNDFVHFNSAGRQITTRSFLSQLEREEGQR